MPGSSNFLPFNPSLVNAQTDAQYLVDSLRTGGAPVDALLPSNLFNKFCYQWSTWIAAMGQMMANKGFVVSDANLATLTSVLAAIITTVDLVPYAPLASPIFTGSPTTPAPSGGAGDNGLHIANTAWVQSFFATLAFVNATFASIGFVNSTFAPINSPAFGGAPTTPSPSGGAGDNSGHIPNTSWVQNFFASLAFVNSTFAPINSPALSGVPTAPTPATGTRSTQIATTAMFTNEFAFVGGSIGFAQKLPSGLIVQFMGLPPTPAGTGQSFVFPLTFPSACQGVVISYTNGVDVNQAVAGNPANAYLNDTRFSVFNGGSSNAQYYAIAWGL